MLVHPDRPFRDAHERHSERTLATTRRHRHASHDRPYDRPVASSDNFTHLLASIRRSAAARF